MSLISSLISSMDNTCSWFLVWLCSSNASKPDHFIANPAELRAKQEARRRQQQEMRSHKRGPNKGQKQKSENTGASTHNTAIQRKRKDANKAKVANHNRKHMATKKASKGMGPV